MLGPTSSGKTKLAGFLATSLGCPIVNCDSVQMYEGLDVVTNKPTFLYQKVLDGEVVSFLEKDRFLKLDSKEYSNFGFRIYSKSIREKGVNLVKVADLNLILEFFQGIWEVDKVVSRGVESRREDTQKNSECDLITNYLFDTREPLEAYSIREFLSDINRIDKKHKGVGEGEEKVVVGGTIYYAYHYILGTDFSDSSYKKTIKPRDSFFVVLIYPKDRKIYYEELDKVVEERVSESAFKEVEALFEKYGKQKMLDWLPRISYEYSYIIKILMGGREREELMQELKYKEHQYAKRQITFMRKLERELEKIG